MDLQIAVIFTPGTVKYLRLAFRSLLTHSKYIRFSAIGNGLSDAEWLQLCELRELAPARVTTSEIPSFSVVPHGIALNFLADRNQGAFFSFCDSDIFALGAFEETLETKLHLDSIFSSCSRIESIPGEVYRGAFGGAASVTECGRPMAASFFCIYPSEALATVRACFGTGFEQVGRVSQMTEKAQSFIQTNSIKETKFDTGKLLSLFMNDCGMRIEHEEVPHLAHIGGISGELARPKPTTRVRITDDDLCSTITESTVVREPRIRNERHKHAKRALATYYSALLRALVDHDEHPELDVKDADYRSRLTAISAAMHQSAKDFAC